MSRSLIKKSSKAAVVLPYDVLEIIVQCLQNHTPSIKRMSLVCRLWSEAARPQIFRKLQLTLDQTKFNELMVLLKGPRYCSFTLYYRSLDIREIDFRTTVPQIVTLFPSLTEFSLRSTFVPSVSELFKFLKQFSNLQSLTLDDFSWAYTPDPDPISVLPNVQRLTVLGNIPYGYFFKKMEEFEVFPKLQRVKVGPMGEMQLPQLGLYLSSPGAPWKVQSLTLGVRFDVDGCSSLIPPPLSQDLPGRPFRALESRTALHEKYRDTYSVEPCLIPLPNIRHFRVTGFMDVREAVQATARLWTPRFLASMSMPNVRCIELELYLESMSHLEHFDIRWDFLDFALTAEDFGSLERVVFILLHKGTVSWVASLLCRLLPLSAERGILYLRVKEDGWDLSLPTLRPNYNIQEIYD